MFFDDVRVPAREPRRRGQRRLVLREVPARQRAGRGRPGGRHQARAGHRQGARPTSSAALADPLVAARFVELENELLALELTALRVVAHSADGKPHPASSVLKLKGTELQQAVSELAVDLAGPLVAGERLRDRAGLGGAVDADVPQPPQGLDLRRLQRDAAPDHRRHHPRTLIPRQGHDGLHARRRAGRPQDAIRGPAQGLRPGRRRRAPPAGDRRGPRLRREAVGRAGRDGPARACPSRRRTAAWAPDPWRSRWWPRRSAGCSPPSRTSPRSCSPVAWSRPLGSAEQRAELLGGLASGERLLAYAEGEDVAEPVVQGARADTIVWHGRGRGLRLRPTRRGRRRYRTADGGRAARLVLDESAATPLGPAATPRAGRAGRGRGPRSPPATRRSGRWTPRCG